MTNDPQEPARNPAVHTKEAGASEAPRSANERDERLDIGPGAGTESSSQLEVLRQDVATIRELIETRLSRDKVKEQAFDRLYEELDRAKRHAAVLENKALYIDLILLYDRMGATCEHVGAEPGPTSQVILSLREELKEVLLRRGITPISIAQGTFDPRFQRAVSAETAASSEDDGKVMRVLREGFACGELIIRPQEVVIGRFRWPTAGSQSRDSSATEKEDS